jgi:hypothetical protein
MVFNQQQLFVVCSLIANIDGSQSTCHAALCVVQVINMKTQHEISFYNGKK